MKKALQHLKVLIIDEISLATATLIAQLDQRLQKAFETDEVFGGVSIVVFGDLLQFPPVPTVKGGKQEYTFKGIPQEYNVIRQVVTPKSPYYLWDLFELTELTEHVRAKSSDDASVLAAIRQREKTEKLVDYLVNHCSMDGDGPADIFRELRWLCHENPAGDFIVLAPNTEQVKELNTWHPAVIMPNKCVNGLVGTLISVTAEFIEMKRLDNGRVVKITHLPFKRANGSGDIWFQFPVAMAEVITVNKSQGMTFDGVVMLSEHMERSENFYPALPDRCEVSASSW
ncbi:hypothetical protein CRE_25851 [Caenorhabditis remanei]|uniref:ATP-dependent DNA helicase n=1 Tax=Caenorhabditis remanei TaxID=31234 RepID=E3NDQ9_CAERE|nr:hypothetical protein CRE_25851 [Caenorhabditis remanei]